MICPSFVFDAHAVGSAEQPDVFAEDRIGEAGSTAVLATWNAVGEKGEETPPGDPSEEDAQGTADETAPQKDSIPDTTPPVIYGVKDRECILAQPIVFFNGVYAVDDVDGEVPVSVQSDIDHYEAGEYTVTYHAMDASGNTTSVSCTFSVVELEASQQKIHQLAKEVMDQITTSDMLPVEKAKAIFDYVHKYMKYGNHTNTNYTDWRKAAYQAFTTHKGDCYNIYAMTRALLDETDIEYLSVERVKTAQRNTRHYWVMVNLGTGWYVFDPTYTSRHKAYAFMWTEKQCNSFRLYWNYDKTILPELATERFDFQKELEREKAAMTPGL